MVAIQAQQPAYLYFCTNNNSRTRHHVRNSQQQATNAAHSNARNRKNMTRKHKLSTFSTQLSKPNCRKNLSYINTACGRFSPIFPSTFFKIRFLSVLSVLSVFLFYFNRNTPFVRIELICTDFFIKHLQKSFG